MATMQKIDHIHQQIKVSYVIFLETLETLVLRTFLLAFFYTIRLSFHKLWVCVCVCVCLPLLFLGMEVRHER